jgi:biopolymer transport protein ExbD
MRFYTRHKRVPTIQVVSLIDILAILLIFFIVTTTFRKIQPQLMINLPKSAQAGEAAPDSEPAVLLVRSAGEIELDGRVFALPALAGALTTLRSASPGRALALQIDKTVPFELVVSVLDALKASGVENIPAFTQSPE